MEDKISLRIVEMSEFFLYLPIDYSNSKTINYYNYIPEKFKISIDFIVLLEIIPIALFL